MSFSLPVKSLQIFNEISSLIFMSQITAQTILCVDRDFSEEGDPESFTDTWPAISRALDAAGYTYDYFQVIEFEDNTKI